MRRFYVPEIHFVVRWPDDTVTACYSPSFVVREFFAVGSSYALDDFLARSREALGIASERVQARYGFPCSRARAELASIEAKCRALERTRDDGAPAAVRIEAFVPT